MLLHWESETLKEIIRQSESEGQGNPFKFSVFFFRQKKYFHVMIVVARYLQR